MAERTLPPVQEGPYIGMVANRRMAVPVNAVSYAQNIYLDDGVWVGRPGMTSLGELVAANNVQGIAFHQELDGTTHWLAFCAGDMFEYDEDAESWTQTDLSSEGITMSPTALLDFANSRGRLIVADGVNDPWMLSGTTGSWTFTTLSSARAGAGVDVYYDKLFIWDLPDPDQNEFEWSDEGDPENGYVADDQVWEFAQRDSGRIVAMVPLNEAMAILKEDSATWLTGAVDEDFQTNANREGLSETEGAAQLHTALVVDGDIYLLSTAGPRMIRQGTWVRINEQGGFNVLEDVWKDINQDTWDSAFAFFDKDRRLVVWMVPTGVSSEIYTGLVYSVDSQGWSVFTWDSSEFDFTAAAGVEDDEGREFVLIGTSDGRVFKFGAASWDDSDVAIERVLRSRPYGRSTPTVVKRLVRLDLMLNLQTDINAEVRPIQNGEVLEGRLFGLEDRRGRKRYVRGFNAMGYDVGWELYQNKREETFSVEASVTSLTVAGIWEDL